MRAIETGTVAPRPGDTSEPLFMPPLTVEDVRRGASSQSQAMDVAHARAMADQIASQRPGRSINDRLLSTTIANHFFVEQTAAANTLTAALRLPETLQATRVNHHVGLKRMERRDGMARQLALDVKRLREDENLTFKQFSDGAETIFNMAARSSNQVSAIPARAGARNPSPPPDLSEHIALYDPWGDGELEDGESVAQAPNITEEERRMVQAGIAEALALRHPNAGREQEVLVPVTSLSMSDGDNAAWRKFNLEGAAELHSYISNLQGSDPEHMLRMLNRLERLPVRGSQPNNFSWDSSAKFGETPELHTEGLEAIVADLPMSLGQWALSPTSVNQELLDRLTTKLSKTPDSFRISAEMSVWQSLKIASAISAADRRDGSITPKTCEDLANVAFDLYEAMPAIDRDKYDKWREDDTPCHPVSRLFADHGLLLKPNLNMVNRALDCIERSAPLEAEIAIPWVDQSLAVMRSGINRKTFPPPGTRAFEVNAIANKMKNMLWSFTGKDLGDGTGRLLSSLQDLQNWSKDILLPGHDRQFWDEVGLLINQFHDTPEGDLIVVLPKPATIMGQMSSRATGTVDVPVAPQLD